ncbi:MAG: primosomal protein [Clostridiales bacterium]|jgi:primosomal protein N' (replication factor Y)|nr:primosomal protein [Clostridiales bacterium]
MKKLYADIVVDISHGDLDKLFQYEVPIELANEIEIGKLVEIPFGSGNRIIRGYVVSISNKPKIEEKYIKCITGSVDSGVVIESQLIKLAWWIKEQYGSTMINSLKMVIPVSKKIKQKENREVILNCSIEEATKLLEELKPKKNAAARIRLLEEIIDCGHLSYEIVVNKLNISANTMKSLSEQGIIKIISEGVYRNPVKEQEQQKRTFELTQEQNEIIDEINQDFDNEDYKTYLIHGVTGSGKTEVYIEIIKKVISKGKQAIVLIPEIALTYQTVKRFYNSFGDRVSVMHSKLSQGERFDQYTRAKKSEIDVMIGPRSALFTPFNNLGIIIIDEEHEMTYKSETTPKYHAREVAIMRASLSKGSVVLGSATPSLEAYQKAINGEYKLFELENRATKMGLPNVEIIDMREELKSGNRTMLSNKLRELMIDRLAKKEQTMLFINRRGYANFVSCRKCGYVVKCTHCDVSLTYHINGKMVCHYCGETIPIPKTCPSCSSKQIAEFGTGTQKVEEYIKKTFPEARVLRMDMDTTSKKDSYQEILSGFSNGDADILVGTQMIVKGHDFPKVTLVGVIAADLSLFSNDFRASERTFQLLTQVAGRAGRREIQGEVVVQTYSPDHYAIELAKDQDYKQFYRREIAFRNLLRYPPEYNMVVILFVAKEENSVTKTSDIIANIINMEFADRLIEVIGPTFATIGKVNDLYRKVVYLKHNDYNVLREIKNYVEGYIEYSDSFKNVMIQFDFNPLISY